MNFSKMIGGSLFVAGLLSAFITGPAHAAPILPVSYVSTEGERGFVHEGQYYMDFRDQGGNQLIDGVLGTSDWRADLGAGRGYEWVGWTSAAPTITFDFGERATFSNLTVGVMYDPWRYIGLPQWVEVRFSDDGTTFSSPYAYSVVADHYREGQRNDLNFDLAGNPELGIQEARYVQVHLHGFRFAGEWILSDEITFDGMALLENDPIMGNPLPAQSVPEPATFILMGVGVVTLLFSTLRKSLDLRDSSISG